MYIGQVTTESTHQARVCRDLERLACCPRRRRCRGPLRARGVKRGGNTPRALKTGLKYVFVRSVSVVNEREVWGRPACPEAVDMEGKVKIEVVS